MLNLIFNPKRTTKSRTLASIAALLLVAAPTYAQQRTPQTPADQTNATKYGRRKRPARSAPVAQQEAQPNLIAGSTRVDLKPINSSATLNVALAVGSVAIIEFPANDPIYYIHPGDARFVAVDDQSTLTQNNILVIRPGNMFTQQTANSPTASVSVQTTSGLTVTFLIFPVNSPEKSAHHVVLVYNQQQIAEERRRLGLASQLETQRKKEEKREEKESAENRPQKPAPPTTTQTKNEPPQLNLQIETAPPEKRKKGELSEQKRAAQAAQLLNELNAGRVELPLKTDAKTVALASTKVQFLDAATALVACSLTNRSAQPIVISEAPPEVRLDTYDKQGRLTNSVPLPTLYVQRSSNAATLAPQQTISYAIVFQLPVLMPQQKLRILMVVRAPAAEVNQIIAK